MTLSTCTATIILFTLAILAAKSKLKRAKNPKPTLIEEANMNKYNHCQKCGKSLGFLSWFKFWERERLCSQCEENQL
jgi:hypothetical protein